MCEEKRACRPDEVPVPKIEVGDLVRLESGGPLMTASVVEWLGASERYSVEGVWFAQDISHSDFFFEDVLEVSLEVATPAEGLMCENSCEKNAAKEPRRAPKVKPGDVVRLKSGGPPMTANTVEWLSVPERYSVEGVWFAQDIWHSDFFSEEALEVVAWPQGS